MTNTDLINELTLKWVGKPAIEIASDVDVIFGGLMNNLPESEHLAISLELKNIGILTNHNENEVTESKGICRRKNNPND